MHERARLIASQLASSVSSSTGVKGKRSCMVEMTCKVKSKVACHFAWFGDSQNPGS